MEVFIHPGYSFFTSDTETMAIHFYILNNDENVAALREACYKMWGYLAVKKITVIGVYCWPEGEYAEFAANTFAGLTEAGHPILWKRYDFQYGKADELLELAGKKKKKGMLCIVPQKYCKWLVKEYCLHVTEDELSSGTLFSICQTGNQAYGKYYVERLVQQKSLPGTLSYASDADIREKPAYYYRQSCVIPFRKTEDNDIEVLVIGSSKRKHYVLPKGIIEPNLGSRESAAKESEEEAGVVGQVFQKVLGTFTYRKWGGLCTVEVYGQEVHTLLPKKQWQENHRGRQWLSPEQAAGKLKEKQFAPIIKELQQLCKNVRL